MSLGAGQLTSTISISERHHYWARERHELEVRRDHVAQSITWMLLLSWFSIVFASLWGMARAEHTHTSRMYMPPLYIHVVIGLQSDDLRGWPPPENLRCTLQP
ncbi:MAG: hypothetical protein GY822_14145 [Deltaproteobacteria bacterium]|nr:hypothetical protein [Deltaproteobacteria bacterium]